MYTKLFFPAFLLLLAACAPSRFVRPLQKNEQAVTAHFGGPLMGYSGAVIPIPLTSVGYGYGLDSSTTVFGNLHTTALLYGTGQVELGVCRSLLVRERWGLSGTVSANLTFDKWEKQFRGWPSIDLNYYHAFGSRNSFVYAGAGNWFELSKYRAHHELQPVHWLFNPHAGVNFHRAKWDWQLETKYILPYRRNEPNVVDYKGIGGYGALGVYFGAYRRF